MSETETAKGSARLGIAGAGRRGVDRDKATEGVLFTIPSGLLKGIEIQIRTAGRTNPHHQRFMEDWAAGKFREALANRTNGTADQGDLDDDSLVEATVRATTTPEYLAHVLVADLPQGVAIPDRVDDIDALPEAIHDYYMEDEDSDGWRRKKNRKDWVEYTPDVGVWLFGEDRYPDLTNWAWRFASQEESYLEEQIEREGNG